MSDACKEMQEHLAAFVDKEGDADVQAKVQAHIESCLACRQDVDGQIALKRHLQSLKRRESKTFPSSKVWENSTREWDRRDGYRRRKVQLRLAVVSACMLLFLFGAVWARLNETHLFPVDAVLRDFRHARSVSVIPAFATHDADEAARYITKEIGVELAPFNLVLSRSELIGGDVITTANTKCVRLLYHSPHGLVGIYISPGGSKFENLPIKSVEGQPFYVSGKGHDIGLAGWNVGKTGFAVVCLGGLESARDVLLDAERSTQQPGR